MRSTSDFVIIEDVLKKYGGPGGDVVIPEGVTSVGLKAFRCCGRLLGGLKGGSYYDALRTGKTAAESQFPAAALPVMGSIRQVSLVKNLRTS